MKIPKIRVDVWIDAEDYNRILVYARKHGLKNLSQAFQSIFVEWRRFQAIVKELQKHKDEEHLDKITKGAKPLKK